MGLPQPLNPLISPGGRFAGSACRGKKAVQMLAGPPWQLNFAGAVLYVWVRGSLADQKKWSLAAFSLPPGHANDHGVWRGPASATGVVKFSSQSRISNEHND